MGMSERFRHLGLLKKALKTLLYMAVGVLVTLIVVFVLYLNGREDLQVWHTAELDEEFTVDSDVRDFDGYLELENRLFRQLDTEVFQRTPGGDDMSISRYSRGSLSDPARWSPDWNRSFIMTPVRPGPSVLLIHGMSDSPYSLRNLAERLHDRGAYVLGLRVPGHGTAPSALVTVTWQDMAAAVRLAVRHLSAANRGQPIHIIGYSNGAALAVQYALATLAEPALPGIESLVLLSPEIGLARVAALAVWQARLGHLLGLDKLAWNALLPEYDPFKYGSFAVNAGDVSYRMTREIQRGITESTARGVIGDLPPILAFSSVVDATVLAPALVQNLFNRLPGEGNRLVLFDINHMQRLGPLLKWRPDAMLNALEGNPHPTFALSVLSNRDDPDGPVRVYHRKPGEDDFSVERLGLYWPERVYSLTHVALPFAPGDPLYGRQPDQASPGIWLGEVALYGERGVLSIPASEMLRLRWNPFYSYLEELTLEFMGLEAVD
jgi:alpha-beta hydrolase superfamily lysophospholipase